MIKRTNIIYKNILDFKYLHALKIILIKENINYFLKLFEKLFEI